MGFSLRPLGRRITDIFDANSAQDQAKRVAVGQPRMYADQQSAAPVRTPMLAPNRSNVSRVWDQVNPLDNNRTYKQALPTTQRSNLNQIGRDLNTGAFGVARSSMGVANDLSGLVDLVTPGTGTNRFTNATRTINENIDRGIKQRGYSTGLYKGAQGAHQAASFLIPGVVEEAAITKFPQLARGAETVSNIAAKVPGIQKLVTAAEDGNKIARVAKWALNPKQLLNVGSDAAQGAGFRTARGQDNSLGTVATDVATSYGLAGGLHLGGKGLNAATQDVVGKLRDKGVLAPSNLNSNELNALRMWKEQAGTGAIMEPGLSERAYAAGQKAGLDMRPTSSDVNDLLLAHNSYNVRKQQALQAKMERKALRTESGAVSTDSPLMPLEQIKGGIDKLKGTAPQVGKTDKPKVGLKKNEKDFLARVTYKVATDKAAKAEAQKTVDRITQKAFAEGNRKFTLAEDIKYSLAMEKLTGVKNPGGGATPPTTPPKTKVIKYPPVGEITEAPKTPGAFQRSVRSIKGVLNQYGETGKDAVRRLETARNNKEITTQAFLDKTKAVWDLDENETIQFFQSLKKLSQGEQPNMSDRVSKAVQEWSDNIPSVRDRAVVAGIQVGDQGKFYAPQTHSNLKGDGELKFINQMIADGKATGIADARNKLQFMKNDNYKPFGSLEKSREVDMPGYDMTQKALSDYVARAHDTIATAEQFGPKGEGKMEIIARLQQEGYNSSQIDKAEEYIDKALKLKQYDKTLAQISSAARQVNAFTTLGTAGISNATQGVNTMTVAGIGRTLKSMAKIMTSKVSRAEADSMGVTLDHAISTIESQQVGTQNRILRNIASPFFREVERFNRRYTALVSDDFGKHLIGKGEFGQRKLKELGVTGEIGDKLTPNQVRELGRGLVETTQFKVDPMDLPGWTDSPIGKLVFQFKPFAYKQTEFMYHQVIKEAGKGNFAPLLRFVTVGTLAGLGSQAAKDVVKGKDSTKDNNGNEKSRLAKVDQAVSNVGGYGMGSNARFLFNNRGSDKLLEYTTSAVGGPTAGSAAEIVNNTSKGFGKNKDWKPMGRDILSKVPTAGPRLANTFLPYEDKGVKPVKAGETATPAQLDDQSTKQLKQMKLDVKAGDNALVQLPNGKYAATINGEVKQFDKLDAARNAARLDHALADGSTSKVLGDKHYYKNEAGQTTAEPVYKYEYDKVNAQTSLDMYVAKDNEDYKGWTEAANTKMAALIKKRDGYNKDGQEDEVNKTQKEIEQLKHDMKKYASYGGAFSKGKNGANSTGRYHVSINAGGSAPRVTARTSVTPLARVSISGGGTKPRVSSAKSRV